MLFAKPTFKNIAILAFLLCSGTLSYGQATITIEVNWPNWSSENRVTFRDTTDTQIGASICNPANCFNGASNSSYNTIGSPETYLAVPYGTNYDLLLEDTWGDGWNGTGSYVRVYQDGILIVDTDLTGGNSTVFSFDINPIVPVLEITDTTINEGAGTVDFDVTTTVIAASGPFTAFYQTNNGSAAGGGVDYTDVTGSLNFSGALNETQTVTVAITDDIIVEFDEDFQLQITHTDIGTVDVSDFGDVTINDNDTIIITDGATVNACNGSFFDTGGIFGLYGNNEDITFTICPDLNGNNIDINFTQFDLQANRDFLRVYEGTSTAGTLIGSYHNDNLPPSNITSTDGSGCLTFRFTSNNNVNLNGWTGVISCIPTASALTINDITVDEDAGMLNFTIEHTGLSTSGPFTVSYNTADGTATAGNDYVGIPNTILNFNGIAGDTKIVSVVINDDTIYDLQPEDFTIQFSASSDPTVDIADVGVGTINDNEVILDNTDLVLVEELDGYIGYTSTGGSLRTQSNTVDACSVTTTSSNTLTADVPAGGTIVKAFLYWAHSNPNPDVQVTFEGNVVDADLMYTTAIDANRIFYGGVSDVTSIVAGVADPNTNSFDFSGLTIDNSATYCSSATVLGGWSLIVFYEDASLPASTVNVYQGFHGESNTSSSYTLDGFFAIGASGSKTTVLSWEGDQTLSNNEALEFTTGTGTFDLVGDGDNTVANPNPFNSTIFDNTDTPIVNNTTSYGVDLDTYDVSPFIVAGESTATTRVESGQDFVILNAVVLKVPSNLVTGTVFEDVNYGGGVGRDMATATGVPIPNATLELYDASNNLIQTTTTDASGVYVFGGMANGSYTIRVVNNTVRSTRRGGSACTSCLPIQTFKTDYIASVLIAEVNAVGGEDSAGADPNSGTLTGAQSISAMTIINEGVAGMDFGFNFNTIVNTNEDGQGSLEQFIVNSNNLDETGLDIEANSIFDPAAGEDTSIFMIPPSADALGRTADANYTGAFFDISLNGADQFSDITGNTTIIDGRTQTAYSGDSNAGTVGGGATVGTSAIALPDYNLPEIQIYRQLGDVLTSQGTDVVIRNVAVYANNNSGVIIDGGSATITESLLGVGADGAATANIVDGIEILDGISIIDANYISENAESGILVNGGTSTTIQNNHIYSNGSSPCDDNISLLDGSGIVIQQNLIDNAASFGIELESTNGSVSITENTITNSGQDGGNCGPNPENAGIGVRGNNSSITNNNISSSGGAGIVLLGGTSSGNLLSQNSIYANGTTAPSLGIDLGGDGVTLNDSGDADDGTNGLINFPVISAAYLYGSNLVVKGWAAPGAIIEVFLTDVNQGTATEGDNSLGLLVDYGEGQLYVGTAIEGSAADLDNSVSSYSDLDGNVDNTNRFELSFALPPVVVVGNRVTSTATLGNTTSEFSPTALVGVRSVITNRRITYRINKN